MDSQESYINIFGRLQSRVEILETELTTLKSQLNCERDWKLYVEKIMMKFFGVNFSNLRSAESSKVRVPVKRSRPRDRNNCPNRIKLPVKKARVNSNATSKIDLQESELEHLVRIEDKIIVFDYNHGIRPMRQASPVIVEDSPAISEEISSSNETPLLESHLSGMSGSSSQIASQIQDINVTGETSTSMSFGGQSGPSPASDPADESGKSNVNDSDLRENDQQSNNAEQNSHSNSVQQQSSGHSELPDPSNSLGEHISPQKSAEPISSGNSLKLNSPILLHNTNSSSDLCNKEISQKSKSSSSTNFSLEGNHSFEKEANIENPENMRNIEQEIKDTEEKLNNQENEVLQTSGVNAHSRNSQDEIEIIDVIRSTNLSSKNSVDDFRSPRNLRENQEGVEIIIDVPKETRSTSVMVAAGKSPIMEHLWRLNTKKVKQVLTSQRWQTGSFWSSRIHGSDPSGKRNATGSLIKTYDRNQRSAVHEGEKLGISGSASQSPKADSVERSKKQAFDHTSENPDGGSNEPEIILAQFQNEPETVPNEFQNGERVKEKDDVNGKSLSDDETDSNKIPNQIENVPEKIPNESENVNANLKNVPEKLQNKEVQIIPSDNSSVPGAITFSSRRPPPLGVSKNRWKKIQQQEKKQLQTMKDRLEIAELFVKNQGRSNYLTGRAVVSVDLDLDLPNSLPVWSKNEGDSKAVASATCFAD